MLKILQPDRFGHVAQHPAWKQSWTIHKHSWACIGWHLQSK